MTMTRYTPREHLVAMRLDKFRLELPRVVEAVLSEIPAGQLRDLVRSLAMTPNEVLPKRLERPQPLVAYAVDLVGRALGLRGHRLEELLKMTVAFVEAGDVLDDAVDGDYAEGHLHQLLAVSSCLHFVATRCALRLGPAVAEAWLESMHELPISLLLEKDGDGSLGTYLRAVASQAALFGAIGRSAAIAAGASEDVTARTAELMKLLYGALQYPQDLREAPEEIAATRGGLAANIMRFMTVEQLAALVAQVHGQMLAALDALPQGPDTERLRELVSAMKPARPDEIRVADARGAGET